MTDGTCSEESYDGSDGEMEDEAEKTTPNVGRPRDFGTPPNVQAPKPGTPGSPQLPGQGASVDVLTEIRKMIKEELGQIPSPTPPGVNVSRAPAQQPPGMAAPNMAIPNMAAPRPQPSPFTPTQRGSPQQTPNAPAFPRPPGVQWSTPPPPPPPGPVTDPAKEISAIDRKWSVLFDPTGVPTKRWEQVVRGIGNYLMDEFMPQNSLVVTPGKMAAFYSHHKLELEAFPFTEIFRSRQGASPPRLAELYQQLACEYYLVPAEPKARPTVPGLTLTGWTRWITLGMRAYPNEEAQRLAKVVAALPINADSLLDGKPERLPKQISRHLLPERADRQARVLFNDALRAHMDATRPPSPTSSIKTPPAFIHLNPGGDADRRPSASRPASPRSRYRPSGIPSPPSSQAGDDDHRRRTDRDRDRDRDRERERTYRDGAGHLRTYESNGSARRDPLPTAAAPPSLPAPPAPPTSHPASSRPPPSSRRRTSPLPPLAASGGGGLPPHHHRHSVSGGVVVGGGRGPERGYTWPYLPRSPSDSAVSGRKGDRERERRERPRERRSASVAGFPERRGSVGMRKTPVVVRDDRQAVAALERCRPGRGCPPQKHGPVAAADDVDSCRLGKASAAGPAPRPRDFFITVGSP
ncbi:hypothetical protein C8A01DRAFT_51040 [Parachaetomium inaequale]|uniref:DUF7514 domain-containing protein n=1 Tax=Parachaetomium inaequale TaxID=2588326 RepID=A0AAN6SKU1_9PEZI|nr:hypothetical protein C8A01DRAFT_51040 [Parachaetomium inaequale]